MKERELPMKGKIPKVAREGCMGEGEGEVKRKNKDVRVGLICALPWLF